MKENMRHPNLSEFISRSPRVDSPEHEFILSLARRWNLFEIRRRKVFTLKNKGGRVSLRK